MAKNKHPFLKPQGRIYNLTFVDSKAYGPHVRAPRGTYKPASPSEALQRNSNRTGLINGTAQPVHRFIQQIAGASSSAACGRRC